MYIAFTLGAPARFRRTALASPQIQRQTTLASMAAVIGTVIVMALPAAAQSPVITKDISIDQYDLTTNCKVATDPGCKYKLSKVLGSGGQIYSTPFLPYDPITMTGDGHGEGADGPRAGQRRRFNWANPQYPYLRLNGLDSQSCFECHNSTGSTVTYPPALMRQPYTVGGSAGFNSNAFINPLFPTDMHDGPLTLFIRNPPHVFGSGYTQEAGDEITTALWLLKDQARQKAKATPNTPVPVALMMQGLDFGTYVTTYTGGAAQIKAGASCPAAASAPLNIGGETGYSDDVTGLKGIPCDLVVRPFQWKGVSSSVRHFARDALDFHFSMQAFEKFGLCDCDRDGLAPELGHEPSVSIGNLSALVTFVTMMRPPVQGPQDADAKKGFQIFTGTYPGLKTGPDSKNMCATCHRTSLTVLDPYVFVEWPTNPNDSEGHPIDPKNQGSWPITPQACPNGIPPTPNTCPAETAYGAPESRGALVTPVRSSSQLAVVQRIRAGLAQLRQQNRPLTAAAAGPALNQEVVAIRNTVVAAGFPDYKIPLSAPPTAVTNLQLPRLLPNPGGSVTVPLFSDLQTHEMGSCLSDPTVWHGEPLPAQGTDVNGINTVPSEFLTRPLWGVADTGPWLHDGRARTLSEAILMHGNSQSPPCTGSSAEPVIAVFRSLTPQEQQYVVSFLLTLHLPLPGK
jgi:hypothetical protein